MHVTQGTFSYLPPLTDAQIKAQIQYCLDQNWPINIEYTDDIHPRNFLWHMWGLPMFDLRDAAAIMMEVTRCREAFPNHYIKVNAYDRSLGRQTTALSFIVNRPPDERGFRLEKQEDRDRAIRYTLTPYACEHPEGERYSRGGGENEGQPGYGGRPAEPIVKGDGRG